MLRAAAKNHEHVAVVTEPADYAELLQSLHATQGTTMELRRRLAAKAYAHTARYDGLIANWLGARTGEREDNYPPSLHLSYRRAQTLRYGENPHQSAALYIESDPPSGIVATARVLAGKELSFNNIADADSALECVKAFGSAPACVIVKHANPCGVALGDTPMLAYERAYACDPTSAFGGIIALNRSLDVVTGARPYSIASSSRSSSHPKSTKQHWRYFPRNPMCASWPRGIGRSIRRIRLTSSAFRAAC